MRQYFQRKYLPFGGRSAESGRSSFSPSEIITAWRGSGKTGNGSSRVKQGGDGSCRENCRDLDIGIAVARISKNSDSHNPRKRDARLDFSSDHPSKAVVKVTNKTLFTKNMDEKWDGYSRTRTATLRVVCREEKRSIAKGKEALDSAEPFLGSVRRKW